MTLPATRPSLVEADWLTWVWGVLHTLDEQVQGCRAAGSAPVPAAAWPVGSLGPRYERGKGLLCLGTVSGAAGADAAADHSGPATATWVRRGVEPGHDVHADASFLVEHRAQQRLQRHPGCAWEQGFGAVIKALGASWDEVAYAPVAPCPPRTPRAARRLAAHCNAELGYLDALVGLLDPGAILVDGLRFKELLPAWAQDRTRDWRGPRGPGRAALADIVEWVRGRVEPQRRR